MTELLEEFPDSDEGDGDDFEDLTGIRVTRLVARRSATPAGRGRLENYLLANRPIVIRIGSIVRLIVGRGRTGWFAGRARKDEPPPSSLIQSI